VATEEVGVEEVRTEAIEGVAMADVLVVGGGLAGCEAAWQLAERGHTVTLREMRPVRSTPAHQTQDLAELVCTNSFKSEDHGNAHGLLKAEMRDLGSILLQAADASRVPAGQALAVDRAAFAHAMTSRIEGHANITLERTETLTLPEHPAIIATGPLTSEALTQDIAALLGDEGLAFYDSIAPIISDDSINTDIAFYASRWDKGGEDDYLNCPMSREEYESFIAELRAADVYPGHDCENLPHTQTGSPSSQRQVAEDNIPYFEGCLPIEVMAERGADTLRFGPMKPVGLSDPRTGKRPWAVVQLRREDRTGQMWNMVGFQTRLRTGEQRRIFRMIPGLENAEFLRTGSIHRNTYLNFPARLNVYGAPPARPDIIFAGQLTGVEGYTESAASGILAGINMDRVLTGREPVLPPATTMMGALMNYLRTAEPGRFQPMNSNFGLLEPLTEHVRDKTLRRQRMVERARDEFAAWAEAHLAPAASTT
ncbi:MAG TPA: methylenetetrahydrofolate--tRNA-(uracil(54)-C(5))-methyltransferase (FADH(2)-oxidizing) TrmFO, partial [Longimicrobiales bacterium]|nr:methylenetetrahydrofolate--tRNA-(uracil(54)-C(5))-methyltransferase (FADH(2)-oxidizing) TrmFO [Longimicrobiales bacterium]